MGQFNNKDRFPILEQLSDSLLYRWNPNTRSAYLDISRADRNINLDEAMMILGILLRNTESSYCEASDDPWTLWFPYLFSQPSAGDKLYNHRTKEIYTIKEVIRDPATKQWLGHVSLEVGINAPKWSERDILSFVNTERYVKYTEEMPDSLVGKERNSSAGHGTNLPPMRPTISHILLREEPASHKEAFGRNLKEIKPRWRQEIRSPINPGYSIEFFGQIFDSLVQFDCWAADPSTSRSLARWFRNFMSMNTWILKKNGVVELVFWAQVRDQNSMQYGQDSHARSVQYLFRTEKIDIARVKNLNNINSCIQVKKEIETENPDVYIAGQSIPRDELTPRLKKSLFYDVSGNPRFGSVSIIDDGFEDNF